MMKRIEVNVQTGAVTELDVLPEEIPPPQPFNLTAAMDRLRRARSPILTALAGVGFDAVSSGNTPLVDAVRLARQELKDLPTYAPALAATSDEEFDAIVLARYRELAAAAPLEVRNAFREVA